MDISLVDVALYVNIESVNDRQLRCGTNIVACFWHSERREDVERSGDTCLTGFCFICTTGA